MVLDSRVSIVGERSDKFAIGMHDRTRLALQELLRSVSMSPASNCGDSIALAGRCLYEVYPQPFCGDVEHETSVGPCECYDLVRREPNVRDRQMFWGSHSCNIVVSLIVASSCLAGGRVVRLQRTRMVRLDPFMSWCLG